MSGHRISEVVMWQPFDVEMYQFTFEYGSEAAEVSGAVAEDGEVMVESEVLESNSKMDELVMERMAAEFIENCSEYFVE